MAAPDNQVKNTGKATQWKKGQSGNPKGRPKNGLCLTSIAKAKLGEKAPDDPDGRTWAQLIVDQWLAQTLSNPSYFKELLERIEGKVPQALEHTGAEGGPIMISDESLVAKLEAIVRNAAKPS